ncbi:MAG TPA: nucleoside monophosphate kinase [Tepidisphaeraceae bacterium]|nr:nucleoside monophosphate kinase [Tepidisphaeraceae bacterium]
MNAKSQNDRAAWLQGSSAKCSMPPESPYRSWRLVLLGPPGVGKGTQAELFSQQLGGCHLSTGDIFRATASRQNCNLTPAMADALQYMRRGNLVPDFTVWEIVRERAGCLRCCGGFVLDGFPRTLPQALAFGQLLKDEGIDLDGVLNYELPTEEIISRLSGRRVCGKCKAVFHVITNPPRVAPICDRCGGELVQREDDRAESIEVRLETYWRDTAPLIAFYRDSGLLVPVCAHGAPKEVFARSLVALKTAITDGLLRSRDPGDSLTGLYGSNPPPANLDEEL